MDWAVIFTEILKSSPQLGMVIIVIWFALKMSENYRDSAKSTMAEWRTFMEVQEKRFVDSLTVIKNDSVTAMNRLSDESKSLTTEVTRLNTKMDTHDARLEARVATLAGSSEPSKPRRRTSDKEIGYDT